MPNMDTNTSPMRVLIWGKTYPELSRRHLETVCTGGVDANGRPVRLYPVPLRYLSGAQQYELYSVIEVRARQSDSDNRPESHKIDADSLRLIDKITPDKHLWAARREYIFRDPSWHFESVDQLKAAHDERGASMGVVQPGEILRVFAKDKPASARAEHDQKLDDLTAQQDLFPREYKNLEFIPFEIRLQWRCRGACGCAKRPHNAMVLDWGLCELGRREGREKAVAKLEQIANLATHDFRLFMGNFFLHQSTFGIIGMWYPKRGEQEELF